ncbi:MAG: type I methionyl aminopeptidase [Saprospiraceae bacterium]|jgi:methionyl aminopeptidase
MVFYKTEEEIELIRENCILVCKTLAVVAERIRPGISTLELDQLAETFIRDHGAVPGFKGYRGFPATLCISVNEQVVHGIPKPGNFVQEGDIVSVDCGVQRNGFYGDAAYTFMVGAVSDEKIRLCQATLNALLIGVEQAVAGNRIGDIGSAIQEYIERTCGFSVVRDLVGHGIGRSLHEKPEVPNYGKRGKGLKLQEGLTIAIEPMVNMGRKEVRTLKDGWTVVTSDKAVSAHYEHTVAVKKGAADILSDHRFIENAVACNQELTPLKAPDTAPSVG